MKNVKMLLAVIVLVAVGQTARGQQSHAGHADHAGHAATPNKQPTARDRLRAAVQEICPVSGEKLGEHGAPIKVAIGKQKEQVFLCCEGCLQGKIDPKHWATIHTNIAKAQGKCPVMKKPLPKSPKWTIVNGQVVFVCCPPCTKKVAADPGTYLRDVDKFYTASLSAKSKASR